MFGKALRATLGVGVGCVVLLIALVMIGGGLANVSQTPKATTPPLASGPTSTPPVTANKAWVIVKQWNGSGIKDTEKFTVGSEWRIDWDFTPGQFAGIIQILIHDEAGTTGHRRSALLHGPAGLNLDGSAS